LISASGQTTVPMSRPSSTAPGGVAAKSRWASTSAWRTLGITATLEAASPNAMGRQRRPGRDLKDRDCGPPSAARLFVIERQPAIQQRLGRGAVGQAGIEMMQPVALAARRRDSVPLPAAAGPSMAMMICLSFK
jgi:hypothetical protein